MLLDSAERAPVVEAFRSGARGVFSRSAPLKMLARCVHRVHEGQFWISGSEVGYLLETLAQAPATRLVDSQGTMLLSEREQDVLRWLVAGFTNRAIARELKIGENTVKNYLFRIFNKLGVSSRVEVVLYAASHRHENGRKSNGKAANGKSANERATVPAPNESINTSAIGSRAVASLKASA